MYPSIECLPQVIEVCKYLSPQERALKGSSELNIEVGSDSWYRPSIIIPGDLRTILQAQLFRKQFKFFTENIMSSSLGFEHDLALSIEEIDSNTGLTLADPRILGEFNTKWKEVKLYPNRDITLEFYQKLERYAILLGRRSSVAAASLVA
jgi:hypothetical protein